MAGNSNSGRRPKPTALKLLTGNPGKRPLNEQEPKPPVGDVVMPKGLSKIAKKVWAEVAPVAEAMGTLTTADIQSFGTLCELEATRRKASSLKSGADPLAAMKLELSTATALRPYYEKFGLEPVGRSRIKVPQPALPQSKWAGIVG